MPTGYGATFSVVFSRPGVIVARQRMRHQRRIGPDASRQEPTIVELQQDVLPDELRQNARREPPDPSFGATESVKALRHLVPDLEPVAHAGCDSAVAPPQSANTVGDVDRPPPPEASDQNHRLQRSRR